MCHVFAQRLDSRPRPDLLRILVNIVVFGDSHCRYFEANKRVRHGVSWLEGLSIDVHSIRGASIIGLGRKRSKLKVFDTVHKNISKESVNVFCFGQVDLELGYYYRLILKDEQWDLAGFADFLLEHYVEFLSSLPLPSQNIVVKGINLSVLTTKNFALRYVHRVITENLDDKNDVRAARARLEAMLDTYADRCAAVVYFNNRLREIAQRHGWGYFDINDILSDGMPINGVADRFIQAIFDHHVVDSIEMRRIHLSELYKVLPKETAAN